MKPLPENTAHIRDLMQSGLSRYELRQPHWRHPYRGLARVAGEDESHPRTRILDALPLLPPCGHLGGWASLNLQGAAYVDGVDRAGNERPVLLHMCDRHRVRTRRGIEPTRTALFPGETTLIEGTPTTVIARAAYDEMCRSRNLTEAVVILDMAVSQVTEGGRCTLASVRRLVERHKKTRGIRVARAALDLASERSASPVETRARLVAGVELPIATFAVNRPIFDPAGRLLGIPDLLDPETGLVIESDGAQHESPEQRSSDDSRDSVFDAHGLTVVRVRSRDHQDRGKLANRLRSEYGRARHRARQRQSWTLTEPAWWRESALARRWG